MGINVSGKIKAAVGGGMRVTGTVVASNAAGANFSCYYGSLPQSSGTSTAASITIGQMSDVVADPASYISIVSRGAVSSSTASDSITAIRNTISAAQLTVHKTVLIPAGDFAYSGNITASSVSIVGVGPTSILRGMDWTNRAIWLKGSSATIQNVTLLTNGVGTRQAPWEYVGVVMNGCSNFIIHNCFLKHSGAAGFQTIDSAGPGVITHNTISGTLADSIHMTDGAHDITVQYNLIKKSGDDGISCVSYDSDGLTVTVKNITAQDNNIFDNLGGRGMSVVGGNTIHYTNNWIKNSGQYAGIYIAEENGYSSQKAQSITVMNCTVENCGSATTGHAGFMVFSDGTYTNDSITLQDNWIIQSGSQTGIRQFGPQTNVIFANNRIDGAGGGNYIGASDSDIAITVWTTGAVGYVAP